MAEYRSIWDAFRDPFIVALVLVGTVGVLWAVVGSVLSHQNSQETRATNQPSTQSMPADTKPQSTQSEFSSTGYHGTRNPSTGNRRN